MLEKESRKQPSNAGRILATPRDVYALTWIGHQYGICLPQLQCLLGEQPGRGAEHEGWISEGAARAVVTRWKKAGWVQEDQLRVYEPFWVWLSPLGQRKVGLSYQHHDLSRTDLNRLPHLYAVNAIRLGVCERSEEWVSERQLIREVLPQKGQMRLHRPDGEIREKSGRIIAIEAELSEKKPEQLTSILLQLLRGERYVRLLHEEGKEVACEQSDGYSSRYSQIWYFGPPSVRRLICKVRLDLLKERKITKPEALRIEVFWYPVAEGNDEKCEMQEKEEEVRRIKEMRM